MCGSGFWRLYVITVLTCKQLLFQSFLARLGLTSWNEAFVMLWGVLLSCWDIWFCLSCSHEKGYATTNLIISKGKMRSFSIQFWKHWPAAEAQLKSEFMSQPEVTGLFQISRWPQINKMIKVTVNHLEKNKENAAQTFSAIYSTYVFPGFLAFTLHFDFDLCVYNVFIRPCFSI